MVGSFFEPSLNSSIVSLPSLSWILVPLGKNKTQAGIPEGIGRLKRIDDREMGDRRDNGDGDRGVLYP